VAARRHGTLLRARGGLRARAREVAGRDAEPGAAIVGGRTARPTGVGVPGRGHDGAGRAAGRKGRVAVDTLGLVLLARAHAADLRDGLGARELAAAAPRDVPRTLGLVWADGACAGDLARRLEAERGRRLERLEVPRRRDRRLWRRGLEEGPRGFRALPRRWVVERAFARLSRPRRLARDYGRLPETGEATILVATSRITLRRLAGSPAWPVRRRSLTRPETPAPEEHSVPLPVKGALTPALSLWRGSEPVSLASALVPPRPRCGRGSG